MTIEELKLENYTLFMRREAMKSDEENIQMNIKGIEYMIKVNETKIAEMQKISEASNA